MTLEERFAMIRGYILARGWENVPMFVDQMGCTNSYEEYRKNILSDILKATEKKESFLDVYMVLRKKENEAYFDEECGRFNQDSRDQIFGDIDNILKDNVNFAFFHTSEAGMIDFGNYEALNGRGKEYNEKLRNAKQRKSTTDPRGAK